MIPDRVHPSWTETVGLMAALKLKMVEAGIFFVVVLPLDFRSNHCNLSSLLPLVSVYCSNHFICCGWCNPMIVQQINLSAAPQSFFQVKTFIRGIVRLLLGLHLHAKWHPLTMSDKRQKKNDDLIYTNVLRFLLELSLQITSDGVLVFKS